MSEAKHTPGPFEIDTDRTILCRTQPGRYGPAFVDGLAGIADVRSWMGAEEADANARLFAAAPNMLAALKAAENFIADELETRKGSFLPGPTGEESSYIAEAENALILIRAAVADAEGQSC